MKKNGKPDPILSFRCPVTIQRAIADRAKASQRSTSQVIRLALQAYFERQRLEA